MQVDAAPLLIDGYDSGEALELACKAHLGVWAAHKRGLVNSAVHWEWSEQAMFRTRLALVAPREHAKSEVFTVNQIAWRCTYTPGIYCYVFAQTGDQAVQLKERIDSAIEETAPWMMERLTSNKTMSRYANWSQVRVAGAGKGVRGAHPDLIVGDDVLSEGSSMTAHQRKKTHEWWFGTIGGMSHAGVTRAIGERASKYRVELPPTVVHLVGTPFHQQDLLMGMRENPMYHFRRYAAEFDMSSLTSENGLAVEVR